MREEVKRVKDYILPVRTVAEHGAENTACLFKNFQDQIYISNNDSCILRAGGYIVLDYGRELHGGVRIITETGIVDGTVGIRIRFGESAGEACAELGEYGATNDHSPRDMKVCLPRLSDLEFGQTGFRFVRIDNISDSDYKFTAIVAAYLHLDEKFRGRFRCDDEKVNQIYDVAAYTLFLNMQNRLWDGIKRDRLVWVGDMHPEVKGILNLFGAHTLIETALKESAEHNPVPMWMTELPSYSVWWIAVLCDYEWYTARSEFARSCFPYLYDVIDLLDKSVTDDGKVEFYSETPLYDQYFLNWETCGEEGRESGVRGLTLWALKKCYSMLSRLGGNTEKVLNIISRLQKRVLFCGESKAVASLYALGYKPEAKAEKLLTEGGAKGFSTFISSYIANALADMGRGGQALSDMKEFYDGMLSRGATTFWESFEPDWLINSGRIDALPEKGQKDIHCTFGKYCYNGYRLSLCHGWSCGPVPFLSERVLGVKFTSAGGKTVRFEPDLLGLERAEGAVPTAYGLIEVSHKRVGEKVVTDYSLPDGVTAEKPEKGR